MRKELTSIEQIEQYLTGGMNQDDRIAFENHMRADEAFEQEVNLQQQIMERINLMAFRNEMLALHPVLTKKPWWRSPYFLSSIVAILLLTVAGILIYKNSQEEITNQNVTLVHASPDKLMEKEQEQPVVSTPLPGEAVKPVEKDVEIDETKVSKKVLLSQSFQSKRPIAKSKVTTQKFSVKTLSVDPEPEVPTSELLAFIQRFVPPFETEVFDIGKDHDFQMAESKSMVHVPAYSMVTASGEEVKGKVEIRYREFRDPSQMVFAQIPMVFHENGEEFNFNSAGMFEIRAYQNGEELILKNETPITVDYNVTDRLENCYFFELEDNKWKKLHEIDFSGDYTAMPNDTIRGKVARKKEKDKGSRDANNPVDIDKSKGMLLTSVRSAQDNSKLDNVKIRFTKLGKRDEERYKTFFLDTCFATNGVEEGDYSLRISSRGHATLKIDKIAIGANQISELHIRLKPKSKRKKFMGKVADAFTPNSKKQSQKFKNSFELREMVRLIHEDKPGPDIDDPKGVEKNPLSDSIETVFIGNKAYSNLVKGLTCLNFGVYNCDQLYRLKNKVSIRAKYVDEKGKQIKNGCMLSLMDMKINAAFSFRPDQFICSASSKNVLILFTADKKMYLLREEEFKKMKIKSSGTYTFKMKEITSEATDAKSLKSILGL